MFQAQLRDSLHRLIFPHFSRKSWKWKVKVKVVQSCPNLGDSMNCTGVGSLSLLQGIFPTQVSNPGLWHCGQILYQLSHKGNQSILEWVVYPFSRGSSRSRNWTQVSYIAGGFFTNWAVREAPPQPPDHGALVPLSGKWYLETQLEY